MDKKKAKIIGIVLIVFAVGLAGVAVKTIFFSKPDLPGAKKEYKAVYEDNEGTDAVGVNEEKAKNQMQLQLEMPDKLEKRLRDTEKLKKELESYLIQEGFWTDVTKAVSDGTITEDFNNDVQILCFVVNNPAQSKVSVKIDNKAGTYDFSYR